MQLVQLRLQQSFLLWHVKIINLQLDTVLYVEACRKAMLIQEPKRRLLGNGVACEKKTMYIVVKTNWLSCKKRCAKGTGIVPITCL